MEKKPFKIHGLIHGSSIVDVTKATPLDIDRAVVRDDLGEALRIIQAAIEQDDGGVALIHFCEMV